MKILPQMYPWTRKSPSNLGTHRTPNTDTGPEPNSLWRRYMRSCVGILTQRKKLEPFEIAARQPRL